MSAVSVAGVHKDMQISRITGGTSSGCMDSRGPLRRPGVSMTSSLGPFSTDAGRGAVGDLLYPRVVQVTWALAEAGVEVRTSTCEHAR